jgi:dipeptidase
MCTRRVWRVFTLAAPSLVSILSPYTDTFGSFGFGPDGSQPYPFSVKPDNLLTVQNIFTMNRDQYEGTQFDLTQGTDAGPFGDPMRFPSISYLRDPVDGLQPGELFNGLEFPRGIALWRTAYSSVTQSRGSLPDEVRLFLC